MVEEELAVMRIGSPQVKIGVFEFAITWKNSLDL